MKMKFYVNEVNCLFFPRLWRNLEKTNSNQPLNQWLVNTFMKPRPSRSHGKPKQILKHDDVFPDPSSAVYGPWDSEKGT